MRGATRGFAAAVALCGLVGAGPAWSASGTRTSSFAYDIATALLTQEVVESGTPSLRLETDYVYDAFGNKTSVTVSGVDIVTRSSTMTYDAAGEFATAITNALSQSESWVYDARFGKPTSHTGPNGLTTTWSYDLFGRKTQEARPDGTLTKWTYQFCTGFNNGNASCRTGSLYPTPVLYAVQATPTISARSPSSPTRPAPWWSATATTPGASEQRRASRVRYSLRFCASQCCSRLAISAGLKWQ